MNFVTKIFLRALVAGLLCAAANSPAGTIPQTIHYQGRLLSGTNLFTGTAGMAFSLYTNSAGGAPAFIDSNATVTVADGLYTADIGANPVFGNLASALSGGAVWLELQVNGVTLSPREQLASVAYALTTGPRGQQNAERGSFPLVAGGLANDATNDYAVAGGGLSNIAAGVYATVAGGWGNGAMSSGAFVGGGYYNGALGALSVVAGGQQNLATNLLATVGGGISNIAGGVYSTVAGGLANGATTNATTVGGGFYNGATAAGATVGGGDENLAYGTLSFIGGGYFNVANGAESAVVGGYENYATNYCATVGGGISNVAGGAYSTVAGGLANGATTNAATVGGGFYNGASASAATVAGGDENLASGSLSAIGGGFYNAASGYASTVPGGFGNGAMADYSLAAGRGAVATNAGSFVWADSQAGAFYSLTNNQVMFRCLGGVRFTSGASAAPNNNVSWVPGQLGWSFTSDRNAKENFHALDVQDVLRRVCSVPVTEWNYIGYTTRNVGPMAQDFHAAFPFTPSDTSIVEADVIGVEWAAIQGLAKTIEQKNEENQSLQKRVDDLEQRLKNLESKYGGDRR